MSMRLRSRTAVTPKRSLMFRMPSPRTSMWWRSKSAGCAEDHAGRALVALHDVVGDEAVAAHDQLERALALADAALAEQEQADAEDVDEHAVERVRGARRRRAACGSEGDRGTSAPCTRRAACPCARPRTDRLRRDRAARDDDAREPSEKNASAAVGYAEGDLAAVPPATLDRFVGLGHPWVMGRADRAGAASTSAAGWASTCSWPPGRSALGARPSASIWRPAWCAPSTTATAAGVGHAAAIEGSASAVPLADGSVDLVTANGLLVLVRAAATGAGRDRPGAPTGRARLLRRHRVRRGRHLQRDRRPRVLEPAHPRPAVHPRGGRAARTGRLHRRRGRPPGRSVRAHRRSRSGAGRTFAATRPGRPAT